MEKDISAYSIKELRAICQKTAPNPEMETYAGRFTRIFSIYTTKLLLRTSLSPNQITILSTAVAFLSAGVFFFDPKWWFIAPLLYILSVILDGSDGEVARFRKQRGGFGAAYTEPVSHSIQYGFLFLIIGAALVFVHGEETLVLLAAAVASSSKLVTRSMQDRFWDVMYAGTRQRDKETQLQTHQRRRIFIRVPNFIVRNIFSSPGIIIPLAILAPLGYMEVFIYLYAVGFGTLFFIHFAKEVYALSTHGSRATTE